MEALWWCLVGGCGVRRAEWTKGMKSHGRYDIHLRYSGETYYRVVYEDSDGRFWIDFYKQKVEVEKPHDYYRTVEAY